MAKFKTIAERIRSARALKSHYSEDVINELQNAILRQFYGVAV
jgi:hypothetical protein